MELLATKTLLRLHRYVGLVAAPLVLFFAISGTWQVFRLQQNTKDGSYKAPAALAFASDIHKVEGMGKNRAALPFKVAVSAVGALLAFTTTLGIVAALRLTRPRWLAVVLLIGGTLLPALLFLIADLGAGSGAQPPPGP